MKGGVPRVQQAAVLITGRIIHSDNPSVRCAPVEISTGVDEKTNNLWEREETDSGEGETWLKIQRVDHSLNS
jgi:hypothetical protein